MEGMDEDDVLWKPAPDRFSIAEVLEHLAHGEGHCYRARLDLFLEEENPLLEAYDTDTYIANDQYRERDPEESFAHFEEQRELNVELLRDLEDEKANLPAKHSSKGAITLSQMLFEWATHDVGHIRQICELKRARVFGPHLGPFAVEYNLKP